MSETPDSTSGEDQALLATEPGFKTPRTMPTDAGPIDPQVMEPPAPTPPSRPRRGTRPAPSTPSSKTPATGSSPESSGSAPSPALRAETARRLENILGGAFSVLGTKLHSRFTPGNNNDAWIPQPGERDMIAGSLGRVAAKRVKSVDGMSDTADLITAGVGLFLYLLDNGIRTFLGRFGPAPMGPMPASSPPPPSSPPPASSAPQTPAAPSSPAPASSPDDWARAAQSSAPVVDHPQGGPESDEPIGMGGAQPTPGTFPDAADPSNPFHGVLGRLGGE